MGLEPTVQIFGEHECGDGLVELILGVLLCFGLIWAVVGEHTTYMWSSVPGTTGTPEATAVISMVFFMFQRRSLICHLEEKKSELEALEKSLLHSPECADGDGTCLQSVG